MKRKTSITLSDDLLRLVVRAGGRGESRSQTIERLVREGLLARARRLADERDLAILNRHADALNREAADVLEYQGDLSSVATSIASVIRRHATRAASACFSSSAARCSSIRNSRQSSARRCIRRAMVFPLRSRSAPTRGCASTAACTAMSSSVCQRRG